jgi:zinc protease
MAFNGTTNFPKDQIVKFIESIGMRFGADLNAGTGFDETTYMLQVPTDKPDVFGQGVSWCLEDWAHNVTFEAQRSKRSGRSSWRNGGCAAAPEPG